MEQLLDAGAVSAQKFSADPRPLDPKVPSSFLQNFVFNHFMYTRQDYYEKQLSKLGLMDPDAFTCTCYMDEVGNTPGFGEMSFRGRSRRRWFMQTPCLARAATAIPVLLT